MARLKLVVSLVSVFILIILFQNFDRVPNLTRIVSLPFGLDPQELRLPANEKLDPAMIELGALLFFDQRLSGNGKMSCATCHQPAKGFSSNGINSGVKGNVLQFKTPTALNRAFGSLNGWKGDKTLRQQSTAPFLNPDEMNITAAQLISKIKSVPNYVNRFDRLATVGLIAPNNGDPVTLANIQNIIETFQFSLMTGDSPADRYEAGNSGALNATQIAGRNLFFGKANCVICHNTTNFTNENFHNIMSGCPPPPNNCSMPTANGPNGGRIQVTGLLSDLGRFKTPSLRNVALRAPYFHNGHDKDLKTVVRGYNRAGDLDKVIQQDPILVNLGLSDTQEDQIVAYLKALTGDIPKVPAPLSTAANASSNPNRENYLLSPDVFNLAFYKNKYGLSTLTNVQIENDWIRVGVPSGRMGSRNFSVVHYMSMYPAVANKFLASKDYQGAIEYYLDHGRRNGHMGRWELLPGFFNAQQYQNLYSGSLKYFSFEELVNDYLTNGLSKNLRGQTHIKGFFYDSTAKAYFYADGAEGFCKFASKAQFESVYGRSDGVGYPRFTRRPNLLNKNLGGCVGTVF